MSKTLLSTHSPPVAQEAVREALATAPVAPIRRVADFALGAACAQKAIGLDSPRTPCQMGTPRSCTPPVAPRSFTPRAWVQSHRLPKPMLMKAFEKKSVADVQAILQQSPEAVKELFWDHDCEPPICCAVRLKCPAAIVQLLLQHGASREDTDVHGRTPAQILAESQQQPTEAALPWQIDSADSVNFFSHMHAAPFDIEKKCPTTATFGSYPLVHDAPDANDLEITHAELNTLLNA